MSLTNQSYDTETPLSTSSIDSGAEDGDGGGVLAVWGLNRQELLDRLASSQFTNKSSFSIPAGVVNSANNPYSIGWQDTEYFHGIGANGRIINVDGTPLSGEARVKSGGTILASKQIAGTFAVNGGVPPGVESGSTVEGGSLSFEYVPETDGISFIREDISSAVDLGVIQYGSVEGLVTDVDGDPVGGIGVSASGVSTTTSSDGTYALLGPGGETVDINAIGTTSSPTLTSGSAFNLDFQLSRLIVNVVTPEGSPIQNVVVKISGQSFITDSEGKATLDRAFLKRYDIDIGGAVSESVTISSQGQTITKSYGNEFGSVSVTAISGATGEAVAGAPVDIQGESGASIASETDRTGKASSLYDTTETADVVVADGDERFLTVSEEVSIVTGNNESILVELDLKDNISTY